jgi:transposase-like protein
MSVDLNWVYKNGRPTRDQLMVRDQVDALLVRIASAGLNMAEVGRSLGMCEKTVDRALRRGRRRLLTKGRCTEGKLMLPHH